MKFIDWQAHFSRLLGPPNSSRVVAAVSGGVDSMAMLHMLWKAGYTVLAAHVNYKLRGDDSDRDEQCVVDYCAKLDIECAVLRLDASRWQSTGLQEKARFERYSFFDRLLTERAFTCVAVAHQSNDQMETMAMQFFRGGRIKALAGMREVSGNIVRPLLCYSRHDVLLYATTNEVPWREDASNSADKYRRNRMRHTIIPLLEQEFPGFSDRLAGMATFFQQTDYWLDKSIGDTLQEHLKVQLGEERLSRCAVRETGAESLILWHWLRNKGFSSDQVQALNDLPNDCSGKRFSSIQGTLWVDRECWVWVPNEAAVANESYDIQYPFSMNHPLHLTSELMAVPEVWAVKHNEAWFPSDWVSGNWMVRRWKKGDRIRVFGSGQSHLVSDVLQQAKVPSSVKKLVWVIERNDQIVWIPGFRTSEWGRIPPEAKQALCVKLHSSNP